MKNTKYLIFIDIDGTLTLPKQNKISKVVQDAILKAKQKGHIFVVATGRAVDHTLGLDGVEVFNYTASLFGAVCYSFENKKLLKEPPHMERADVENITKYFSESDIRWTYKDDYDEKSISEKTDNLFIAKQISIEKYLQDLENNKIIQLLCDGYLSEQTKAQFPNFSFYEMPGGYTDITIKNFTKASSVEYFKTLYPDYVSVSIGDSVNDVGMFEAADISIAMGNSSDEIKELTTYQTKSVAEDGVAYALEQILKI